MFTKVFSGSVEKSCLAKTKMYLNATVKPVTGMHYRTGRLHDGLKRLVQVEMRHGICTELIDCVS